MRTEGRILSLSGGLYSVETESGILLCFAKGSFRKQGVSPVAGDLVVIDTEEKIGNREKEQGARGVITQILPRKNVLIRPPLANLDTLFLVAAVKDPEPVLLSIDKLLAITRHNNIQTVLVFTKKELDPARAEELCSLYRNAGFPAFAVSKLEEEETRALLYPCIQGNICALAGASGVGKSTLINTLFPFLSTETGSLSEKNQRGKHTTRQSTLYDISDLVNKEEPVYVADTPGFSLLDFDRFFFMEKEDLAFAFPEFEPLLGTCKYSKCSHQTEDGCKILAEVERGAIAKSRHDSYLALLKELNKTNPGSLIKRKPEDKFRELNMNHFSFELSLIAVLPALFLCAFVFYKDRIEKEPIGLLALLFGAGAIAYVPSTMAEKWILDGLAKLYQPFMNASAEGFVRFADAKSELTYLALCAFLGFSLVRICLQWGILFLITYKNKNFNHLFDGIVYSVFLSLGFAVAENVHFLMQNDVEFLLPKLITSVPCQLFIGIIMGYFYTMGHMRFAANEIEEKLLKSGTIQKDNIKSSAPWLISGVLIPCLISGIYHLAGSAKTDALTTAFYTLVFLIFGISFFVINQIASKDVSYGKYLFRIIAKAHPELPQETIKEHAKTEMPAKQEGQK